jgi:gliding motility-associated-like protein
MTLIDSTTSTSYIDSISPLGVGGTTINGINQITKITGSDCYYVFARNHCGIQSDASNNGCVIILNAKNNSGYNSLDWNRYQTWNDGIEDYNVYVNNDNTGWQLIGTTSSGTITNFNDYKLDTGTIDFCYQVEAVENPGQYNQLSRSTVTCVHQDATVFIPNAFSHYNLDGLNDFFGPVGLYIKNYTMQIYNRWGERIYSTNSAQPWDGTFRGQGAQKGVYIYLITIEDYNGNVTHFKGNVTIYE